MFVDASASVAILTREPEADGLDTSSRQRVLRQMRGFTFFAAALRICRKRHTSVEEAEEDVREFLEVAGIELIPITAKEGETALAAFSRYGKGRAHPAQLNIGDCFAYAAAKNHRRALLFKGNDFNKTDIRVASRT